MNNRDKVATIVPIPHLDLIQGHKRFMALTHLMDNPRYRGFYEARVKEGAWVIFDNSTVELGQPEPLGPYLVKALELGASEVLLPDWLYDKERTLVGARDGLRTAARLEFPGSIMGVPQGHDANEWLYCLQEMLNLGVNSIGISRRYASKFGDSRLFACYAARSICVAAGRDDVMIHLLGSQGRPELDAACLNLSFVEGIDSALPVYFAKEFKLMMMGAERPATTFDFEETLPDRYLLSRNIERWRDMCSSVAETLEPL